MMMDVTVAVYALHCVILCVRYIYCSCGTSMLVTEVVKCTWSFSRKWCVGLQRWWLSGSVLASVMGELSCLCPERFHFWRILTKWRKTTLVVNDFWLNLTKFNQIANFKLESGHFYYFTVNQRELSPQLQRIFNSYRRIHKSVNK